MQARPSMLGLWAACREVDARAQIERSLAEFLDTHGIEGPDRVALLTVGPEKILAYRSMVHSRHHRIVSNRMPRVAARLADRLRADVAAFLAGEGSRSPYLRDLPVEFVTWAAPRWADAPDVPNYIPDLARHEVLDEDVAAAPGGGEEPTGVAIDVARSVAFEGTARLVRYEFAVHELASDPEDRSEPDERPTTMLVYRDAKHEVRYLDLTPLGAAVLAALLERRATLGEAVAAASQALGEPVGDEILKRIAVFLGDLVDRGVALGAA